MTTSATSMDLRWADVALECGPALRGALERLAGLSDVALNLRALAGAEQALVWRLAEGLAAALPSPLRASLESLRRGELDVVVIDGEPERADLPETLDAIDRRYEGSLYGDWLGLAYASRLGADAAAQLSAGHLRIEWQLGSEALHRDGLVDPAPPAGAGWSPRMPVATFSSLCCLRPGSNPAIRTVVAHRAELLGGPLAEHLEVLARPIFRCALLARQNPPPGDFPILAAHPRGGWDLSAPALESSLHLHQRARGDAIACRDPAGRRAVDAFVAARTELRRYPRGVRWLPGRRLLIRQEHCFHGREGGVAPDSAASWASERWLSRMNLRPATDAAPASPRAWSDELASTAVERLRGPAAAAKTQWLARRDEGPLEHLARSLYTTG